jgi:hypothetical protein
VQAELAVEPSVRLAPGDVLSPLVTRLWIDVLARASACGRWRSASIGTIGHITCGGGRAAIEPGGRRCAWAQAARYLRLAT